MIRKIAIFSAGALVGWSIGLFFDCCGTIAKLSRENAQYEKELHYVDQIFCRNRGGKRIVAGVDVDKMSGA